ncbi:MAG TPA: hypothetical protein VFD49_09345 [Candidatus Dormibacteraeota bacterium]|nr:hypothetical protein [Candidatus Dormibacteraeota bacterium]
MRDLRRGAVVALVLGCVPALGTQPAAAAGPRFVSASAVVGAGGLDVPFAEVGLPAGVSVADQARADATVAYGCGSGGRWTDGNASEMVSAPVSRVGRFVPGSDGSVRAVLSLSTPGPGGFACPPGEQVVLTSVTYANVSVTDVTNGVDRPVSGTFAQIRVGP